MHPLNSPNFEYRIQPSLEAKNNFYWRNLLHYGSHPNFSYNTANNWSYHDPSYFHNP